MNKMEYANLLIIKTQKLKLIFFTFVLLLGSFNFLSCPKTCDNYKSLVSNPGFEEIECDLDTIKQGKIKCAKHWDQLFEAGSTDLIYLLNNNSRPGIGDITGPPNMTKIFAGLQSYKNRKNGPHHEYLRTLVNLESKTEYLFKALVGSGTGSEKSGNNEHDFVGGYKGDLILFGATLEDTNYLPGIDCIKVNDSIVELARICLNIPKGKWLSKSIHRKFFTNQKFNSILIGIKCDIKKRRYLLIDDIFIAKAKYCPPMDSIACFE